MTVSQVEWQQQLADTAPGAQLAALLESIDLATLSGFDCVDVLQAQARQANHERARFLAAVAEVVCRDDPDGTGRTAVPSEFAFDEVRAALVLTRRGADAVCGLAFDLVVRLPAVHAAMLAGVLDEPRARVFCDWTAGLSAGHARAVCAALLPAAPACTTGQLAEHIKRYAVALDPGWARRRYEQAVRGRRLVGTRNPDGSANLAGYDLPVDRVAAACTRIDALAKAAKHAGRPEPIDQLRADLFLDLTDGRYTGLDDAAILAALLTDHTDPDDPAAAGAAAEPANPGAVAGSAGRALGPGLELRVELTTLLGRDERPAELAGWGPIHAGLARDLAVRYTGGSWTAVVTDRSGHPIWAGPLRRRPAGWPRTAHAGQVELQVSEHDLRNLAGSPELPADWTSVVAEIVANLRVDRPGNDSHARLPGAGLRRWLRVRDRSCIFPGCRVPARHGDADHTIEHHRGGPTTEDNLGIPCRHDHRLRHDGGWRLVQLAPGHFVWISRLGRHYERRPPPAIHPLPDPMPDPAPAEPDQTEPDDDGWADSSCLQPEPKTPPEPPAPPPSRPADIPPF